MKYDKQQGFTLIELLIAMLIFAMLALSGWQIMDALSKSRERAKIQIEQLSDLQYAYLQMSQDFAQVSNFVAVPTGISLQNDNLTHDFNIKPTFTLNSQQVEFVRFANFDPRLNPPPSLAKVRYIIQDDKLIKERSYQLTADDTQFSHSVILNNIQNVKWQAWSATPTPELVNDFPDHKTLEFAKQQSQTNQSTEDKQNSQNPTDNSNSQDPQPNKKAKLFDLVAYQQIPKGVIISFSYHEQPIVWQFSLAEKPPTFVVPNGVSQ